MAKRLVFSQAEFARRVAAVRAEMASRGADVVLLDEQESLAWVTGYDVTENLYRCCVLPLQGEPVMILRRLDEMPMRDRSWVERADSFVDWEGPIDRLARTMAENGWADRTIAVDLNSYCMPAGRYAAIQAALPKARFVDFSNVIRTLRLVKSAEEIAILRRAAAVCDQAVLESVAALRRGGTDRDASAAAAAAFVRLGAENHRIGRISTASGWGFLHADLSDRPLGDGDVVHLELCPRVNGYTARIMRPVVVGAPTKEQEHTARILIDAQDRQIASMRPGALAAEVDALGRDPILAAGLRDTYDNITGYTLGLYGSATPRTSDFTRILHPKADWRLEAGMVMHVYNSAKGLAFSETVLIAPDGPDRLTKLDRRIFSI